MKKDDLKNISTVELQNREKSLKTITYLLIGTLFLLFLVTIYTSIHSGFSALSALPFALLPIAILNLNSISEIKKELKARNV